MRPKAKSSSPPRTGIRPELIVIGASAGAINALLALLPRLPQGYSIPIAVVIHAPADRKSAVPELFAARCAVKVKEAEDKEAMQPGTVYFGPSNYHLLVEKSRCFSLSVDPPVMFSRPSIDVLFESAADALRDKVLGIVLTGANNDGARGLSAICRLGGMAVVQDPAEADSPQMPRAAHQACPEAGLMSLEMIHSLLQCFKLDLAT